MSVGKAVAEVAAGAPTATATTAVLLGIVDEQAQLLLPNGETVLASKASSEWPALNSVVWCITLGAQRLMLGQPSTGSAWGRVTSVGSGTAVVEYPVGSGKTGTFALARGATAAVGDTVRLDHQQGGVILAAYATTVPVKPTDPIDTGRPKRYETKTAEVSAEWDGTAQPNGFWLGGSRLYTRNTSGSNNFATIGYGSKASGLGIDPATITEAAVYLHLYATGSAHTGALHNLTGKTANPSPTDAFAVTPTEGWLKLPLAVAQKLASGAARGLTFYGGSGTVLGGRLANAGFGRLRLRYQVEV